jgi:hypothetical protein
VAAALALQVYGIIQDPGLSALGAQILQYGLYGHIAAWLLTSFALFGALGATRAVAVASTRGAAAEAVADETAVPAGAPAPPAPSPPPDEPPPTAEAASDETTVALARVTAADEPQDGAPDPAEESEPRPLAADERTVRAIPPSEREMNSKPVEPSGEAKPVTVVRRPGIQPEPERPAPGSPGPDNRAARPASEDDPTVRNSPPPKSAADVPGGGEEKD